MQLLQKAKDDPTVGKKDTWIKQPRRKAERFIAKQGPLRKKLI